MAALFDGAGPPNPDITRPLAKPRDSKLGITIDPVVWRADAGSSRGLDPVV
jgi:hypothetical protein